MTEVEQTQPGAGFIYPPPLASRSDKLDSPLIIAAFGSQISADLRESALRQSA